MTEIKFCHECGRKLEALYPGCFLPVDPPEYIKRELALPPDERTLEWFNASPQGDPESGPKEMRCPAGHATIAEYAESRLMEEHGRIIGDFLDEIRTGERSDASEPEIPLAVQVAAETLVNHRLKVEAHWDAVFAAQEQIAETSGVSAEGEPCGDCGAERCECGPTFSNDTVDHPTFCVCCFCVGELEANYDRTHPWAEEHYPTDEEWEAAAARRLQCPAGYDPTLDPMVEQTEQVPAPVNLTRWSENVRGCWDTPSEARFEEVLLAPLPEPNELDEFVSVGLGLISALRTHNSDRDSNR